MTTFKYKNGKFVISEGYGSLKKIKEADGEEVKKSEESKPTKKPTNAGEFLQQIGVSDEKIQQLASTASTWGSGQKNPITLDANAFKVQPPEAGKDEKGSDGAEAANSTGDAAGGAGDVDDGDVDDGGEETDTRAYYTDPKTGEKVYTDDDTGLPPNKKTPSDAVINVSGGGSLATRPAASTGQTQLPSGASTKALSPAPPSAKPASSGTAAGDATGKQPQLTGSVPAKQPQLPASKAPLALTAKAGPDAFGSGEEEEEEELDESKYINPRRPRKIIRHSSLLPYRR